MNVLGGGGAPQEEKRMHHTGTNLQIIGGVKGSKNIQGLDHQVEGDNLQGLIASLGVATLHSNSLCHPVQHVAIGNGGGGLHH